MKKPVSSFWDTAFEQEQSEPGKENAFTGFTPAVSKEAIKNLRAKINRYRKLTNLSITELAQILNPIIQGWANYFYHYTPSAVYSVLSQVNLSFARWVMKKYKRFKRKLMAALHWLGTIAQSNSELFAH